MKQLLKISLIFSLVFGFSLFANSDDSKDACGEISIFFNPPLANDIFPATINQIDDEKLKRNRHSYRLKPGKHIIKLHRNFSDPSITGRSVGIDKSKALEINVEANTSYHLGAKYIRKNKNKTFKEKFWEPVVWKKTKKSCSF
jgi:hypothetical protein